MIRDSGVARSIIWYLISQPGGKIGATRLHDYRAHRHARHPEHTLGHCHSMGGRILDRVKVRSAAVEIESLFSAARHIAIARAAQATVEIDPVAQSINISVGSDTVRKREIGAAHDVQISATRARMSYSATGMGYGAANLSVVVRRNACRRYRFCVATGSGEALTEGRHRRSPTRRS